MSSESKKKFQGLMTTFNHENFLSDSLASLDSQTDRNLDLVISDDNSGDSSFDLVNEFLDRAKWRGSLRVRRNRLRYGMPFHLISLMDKYPADYFLMFSGDDVFAPDQIRVIKNLFESRSDLALVSCDSLEIDSEGRITRERIEPEPAERIESLVAYINRRGAVPYTGAGLGYSGSVFSVFGDFYRQIIEEDHVFYFRALLLGDVAVVRDIKPFYRRHANSLSAGEEMFAKPLKSFKIFSQALGGNSNLHELRKRIFLNLQNRMDIEKAFDKEYITNQEYRKFSSLLEKEIEELDFQSGRKEKSKFIAFTRIAKRAIHKIYGAEKGSFSG